MKKLLSLLTITTLTASVPAPLLANTVQTRVKRNVSTLSSKSNDDYVPIKKINGINYKIQSQTIDNKNNIYLGTDNGIYVLKHTEITPTKINDISGNVISVAIYKNDNIYFATYIDTFVLKHGETTPTKINGINDIVYSLLIDSKDNIYFGTNRGAFVLKQGETTPTKINGINDIIRSLAVDSNDNLFIGTNKGLYNLVYGSDTPTKINGINDIVYSLVIDRKDNIYLVKNTGAFVLKQGATTPTKINGTNDIFYSLVIDSKDNIYFGTDSGAFVLKQGSDTPTKINGIIGYVYSLAVDTKDNIYFCNKNRNIYIYYEKYNLNKVIKNNELNLINASNNEISDKAILSELNYRNPELDISQLEVINKTNNSATIKSKDNSDKYFGEKKIYFIVNNELNKNIVLYDLIKKAIFFKLKDDNINLKFSKIKDINLSYLQYSNIELKETITPQINIEDVYQNSCTGQSGLINNGSLIQTFKTPECRKTIENEIRIQLSNGLIKSKSLEEGQTTGKEQSNSSSYGISKTNTKSLEIIDAFENIDVKQSSESSGWHAELSVSAEASFNVGVASGSVSTTASGGYNKNSETSQSHSSGHTNSQSTGSSESNQKEETKTKIISQYISASKSSSSSNNVSLENTNVKSTTTSEQITWPSQEIKVNPKSKATITIFIKKVTNQITLDLKQDISGNVIVKVKNKNGEEETIDFSIGELMKKLIQHKLLPSQISISEFDENDIYFEGQINFLIKKGFKQDIIIDEIKLN